VCVTFVQGILKNQERETMVFDRFRLKSESATLREIKSQIEGSIQVKTTPEDGQDSPPPPTDVEQSKSNRPPDSDNGSKSSKSMSNLSLQIFRKQQSALLVKMILILGLVTTASFLSIGLTGALASSEDDFIRSALFAENKVIEALGDYINAGSLVHARCRHNNFTRTDFRELYEYLNDSGLVFQAVQWAPNITNAERPAAEEEQRAYLAENYPYVNYTGFRGFNTENSGLVPRWRNQSYYFPIHYQEPIPGNEAAIDLDYYSSESRRRAVDSLFTSGGPALTDRLVLVNKGTKELRCGSGPGTPGFGVVLMHPGVNLTTQPDVWPWEFSAIVICIRDILIRSISVEGKDANIFIHDLSDPHGPEGELVFLGAAEVKKSTGENPVVRMITDDDFSSLVDSNLFHQQVVKAANRNWIITIVHMESRWDTSMLFIILGGVIIMLAATALAIYVRRDASKTKRYNELKQQAGHEKAALILKNARQATKTERELNDFIAHEVRNPVAAAMAACNFVQSEMNKKTPFQEKESLEVAQGDMSIIENSLKFVNDLLRNMLDMHRAGNKQLQVDMVPTDLKLDIIEPVAGMLHAKRGNKVKVIVECPDNLWISADPLRLKQVILNLGRNSSKFIEEGFIRLKAEEVDGNVKLYVDDSGSGIPKGKRDRLFAKFQESLDVLSQGTGIGLYLCKSLVDLMGGKIYLADDYHSGIEGHPGTSFVIDMQAPSVEPPEETQEMDRELGTRFNIPGATEEELHPLDEELPENIKVLFVDDDPILRKLFKRSVLRVAPDWEVREASNGETALVLTESEQFDLIFVDMYMASVEKQLLGTETVAALRHAGVNAKVCGLSANDLEEEFLQAGANAFMFKPFPCEAHELQVRLVQILKKKDIDLSIRDFES